MPSRSAVTGPGLWLDSTLTELGVYMVYCQLWPCSCNTSALKFQPTVSAPWHLCLSITLQTLSLLPGVHGQELYKRSPSGSTHRYVTCTFPISLFGLESCCSKPCVSSLSMIWSAFLRVPSWWMTTQIELHYPERKGRKSHALQYLEAPSTSESSNEQSAAKVSISGGGAMGF